MNVASGAEIYGRPEIVAYYDREQDLHGAERQLFDRYIKPGCDILDIGVGAGRTTPYLSRLASRYVGADLSEAMIARCQEKFPNLTFLVVDATDLSALPDASFDVVVFSFNGIDVIPTVEDAALSGRVRARVAAARAFSLVCAQSALPPLHAGSRRCVASGLCGGAPMRACTPPHVSRHACRHRPSGRGLDTFSTQWGRRSRRSTWAHQMRSAARSPPRAW